MLDHIRRFCISSLILFLIVGTAGYAQTKKSQPLKKQLPTTNFLTAAKNYRKLLDKEPDNDIYQLKLYDCYIKIIENTSLEASLYQTFKYELLPINHFLTFSKILANNNHYDESRTMFKLHSYILNEELISKNTYQKTNSSTLRTSIGITSLNTSFSELSPCYYFGGLVYASNKKTNSLGLKIESINKSSFDYYFVNDTSKLYSEFLKAEATNPIINFRKNFTSTNKTKEKKTINSIFFTNKDTIGHYKGLEKTEGEEFSSNLNTKFNEGQLTFTKNFDTVYYTRSFETSPKFEPFKLKNSIHKIFWAVMEHNKWIEKGEFPFNGNDFSCAHPSISPDGKTLYYASDMAGGKGGTDLYKTELVNGVWIKPINLGNKVNGEHNELFPFIDKSGNLFFASDGHKSMGGLDIFQTEINSYLTSDVQNIGIPINSIYDDFGLILTNKSGYFCSNRMSSANDDDIYTFSNFVLQKNIVVKGKILEEHSSKPIINTKVFIQGINHLDSCITDVNGSYSFKIQTDSQYLLKASAKDYASARLKIFVSPQDQRTNGLDTNVYMIKKPTFIAPKKAIKKKK